MKTVDPRPTIAILTVILSFGLGSSAHLCAQATLSATEQISGGSTTSGSFLWNQTGNLLTSPHPLSNGLPAEGAAVFFWDATKGSLFSGLWTGWTLTGEHATALGASSAEGEYSFASGLGSGTWGLASAAFGASFSGGDFSFAAGTSTAYGLGSVALGASWAEGDQATSIGTGAAYGVLSFAGGDGLALGDFSTALGSQTRASAYASVAIGRYNLGTVGSGGETSWLDADPIFEIGIGVPGTAPEFTPIRANALTVYKDGTVVISKRQGDILMGEFGN